MADPPAVSDFDDYDGDVLNNRGRDEPPQQQQNPHHQQNGRPRYNGDDHDDNNNNNAPHYLTGVRKGKPTSYFVNGDQYFTAKKIVFNHKYFRDMTHYLDHLTDKLNPKFGAIRKIHTPMGGRRIYDINDLQPGGSYVAAGNEKFKRIAYDQIIAHERKKSPPFKYDANPVVHSRVFKSSARFGKQANQSIIVKVWPNGGEKKAQRPRVVLLRRTPDWNMTQVVVMVNEMLADDCNGAVESIYDTNGCKLSDVSSLEHNGVYVALTRRERFKKAPYKDFAAKDLHISPRPDRKGGLDPLFSGSNNSTSHSSPEHSNASSSQGVNGYSRRRPPRKEEDQVFPAKPVKYNRSSERNRKVDLDKDEGGIFKAKGSNSNTRGAREINDSRDTKTELPLDQQKAQTVDDETPTRSREERNRPQYQQRGGYTEAKTNSRRPPPRAAQVKSKPKEEDDDFIRDIKMRREQSAVKIQAGYRGYKARKQVAEKRAQKTVARTKTPPRDITPPPAQEQRTPSEPRQSWTPLSQTRGNNSHTSPSPPPAYDFREEEAAATKIQAGFRGFKTRKEVEARKTTKREVERGQSEIENYQSIAQDEAQKMVSNVSDRFDEEEKAATRIQAGFRGHQARKEYQARSAQNDIQSRNREEEEAATKIQAGFRGHKARSSLRERNQPPKEPSPVPQPPPPAFDDDDDEEEEDIYDKAATRIQAGFKGYQVRKNLRF